MKSIKTYTNAREALKDIFGYDDFRGAQGDIIKHVNTGVDGMVVMATGNGKSLCFQIPALMSDGITIVVTPLISLMKDQVDALVAKGVPAVSLYGEQDFAEKEKAINLVNNDKAKLLYVSPEKLLDEEFQDFLATKNIARFAIDEAHCVSIWGRNFRKSYTHLGEIIDRVGHLQGERIQRIALTATANDLTRLDIGSLLHMQENSYEFVGSFDRPNLEFSVRPTKNKMEATLDYIIQNPNEPTIVYSATVKQAEKLVDYLNIQGVPAGLYHGRMKAEIKNAVQDAFMKDDLSVIVATNAFGMGVDKPNVRHVIHLHMPGNIENFYQEAGRLGRDGGPGKSVILYSDKDRGLQEFFINANYPDPDAVLATRTVLGSFDPSEPLNLDKDIIAQMSTMDLKPMEVDAALNIMEDQGLLSIKHEIDYSSMNIEIKDLTKPLDLSFIGVRRQEMAKRLHQMVRYCVTKACRTDYLTSSLGDAKKHGNCGRCDNCKRDLELDRGNQKKIAEEVITNTLGLVKDVSSKGIAQRSLVEKMLLGTHNLAIRARKWDELPQFGSLKNWTKDDVTALMDHCLKNDLVKLSSDGRIEIGSKGNEWVDGKKVQISAPDSLRHKGIGEDQKSVQKTGSQKPTDTSIKSLLENWRKRKAHEIGVPEIWIIDDSEIQKIARENHVNSKEKLIDIGISTLKVNKIGDNLLSELKQFYAHQPPEFSIK